MGKVLLGMVFSLVCDWEVAILIPSYGGFLVKGVTVSCNPHLTSLHLPFTHFPSWWRPDQDKSFLISLQKKLLSPLKQENEVFGVWYPIYTHRSMILKLQAQNEKGTTWKLHVYHIIKLWMTSHFFYSYHNIFCTSYPSAFTGFETANKYKVKNSMGQQIYFAAEDTDCCSRNCCGPLRAFDMQILDNSQNEVIHLNRPLACTSCCFPCCLQVCLGKKGERERTTSCLPLFPKALRNNADIHGRPQCYQKLGSYKYRLKGQWE